jgi:hypothetical protein
MTDGALTLRYENLGKEDGCRIQLETFRWNHAGNQARPEELGQRPEASLAWWQGNLLLRSVDSQC